MLASLTDLDAAAGDGVIECIAVRSDEPFPPPFMDRVDLRLHPR